MYDIVLEIVRALIVGLVFTFLLTNRRIVKVHSIRGWNYIICGFGFIFLGMLVDITDNFNSLNKFIIIGDTEYQAFIEKVVGYLFGFSLLAAGIRSWIPGIIELDTKRNNDLEEASKEIKALSGLLPICMDCKKIRDDDGYWNQLEKYISEHTEAEMSHGFCEECLEKRYPERK